MRYLRRFLQEETAATAVEYAVMLSLILLTCIGAIAVMGTQTQSLWSDNNTGLQRAFNQ